MSGWGNADGHMASLAAFWDAGKIVICATLQEGPQASGQILCATDRLNFRASIRHLQRRATDALLADIASEIHAQVLKGVAGLTLETDKQFMDNIAALMAFKLAAGDEAVLDGSGLFSLVLAVSPDAAAPWHKRGFLYPRDVPADHAQAATWPVMEV